MSSEIPYLARHYRVVTFDGRGNGRSDRPPGPEAYTAAEYAADAMAVAVRLAPLADRVAEAGARSATLALSEGPVASAPLLELRAEAHAVWPDQGKVRLFAS